MSAVYDRARELTPDVVLLDAPLGPKMMVESAKTLANDTPGVAVILLSGEAKVARLLIGRLP